MTGTPTIGALAGGGGTELWQEHGGFLPVVDLLFTLCSVYLTCKYCVSRQGTKCEWQTVPNVMAVGGNRKV